MEVWEMLEKINERGEQVVKYKKDVLDLLNSSISHLPRLVYQGVDFNDD
jgi:hypothetical protein